MSSIAAATVVGGVVGGVITANSQKSAARSAANATRDANNAANQMQMDMYNQSRDDYAPYRSIGSKAVAGYNNLVNSADLKSNNALTAYKNYNSQALPSANIAAPNLPGANLSINMPDSKINMRPGDYAVDTNQARVDPTQYQADASRVLDFKMNPEDAVYKWKMDQARKSALGSLAASGMSGSKYGMSMQQDAAMGVAANEADSQFNRELQKYGIDYQGKSDLYGRTAEQAANDWGRQYQQSSDLYNRQYQLDSGNYDRAAQNALTGYQVQADNYNRGYQNEMAQYGVKADNYTRGFQNASYTDNLKQNNLLNQFNMTNALSNQDYSRQLDAIKIGAGAAGQTGQWANAAGANAAQLTSQTGQARANSALQQGQANADLYSGLASLPFNALSLYKAYNG
jgi:hypothetical protein